MGQFLAVGITTRIVVDKEDVDKARVNFDDVVAEMRRSMNFDANLYDWIEQDGQWVWQLKSHIWEGELLEFLKAFYPSLYAIPNGDEDYNVVLGELEKTEPHTWMGLAEEKQYEQFQFDRYCAKEYLVFRNKHFLPRLRVKYQMVLLALEGKILMETYGVLFGFFAFAIQKAFADFKLARTIRVYITG
jgi:hypothetical protein